MKKLSPEDLRSVVRELDQAPYLVRWLKLSRDENRVLLEGAEVARVPELQGQNNTINQILDKCVNLE